MSVDGACDPRFAQVRDEFERNLAERGEVGASVCVTLAGETVVDLWGGTTEPSGPGDRSPWTKDTLALMWSATKGATALCAHMLASRGVLDLDAPVAQYWPEFAKNGKDAIPVRMLLCHQAGLAAFHDPLPINAFYDWDVITDTLAGEEPFWEPGTRHGYHGTTFGHLVGEVVRRVDGRSLGTFFREEVAQPFGLDLFIGLPEEHESRVAPNIDMDMPASPDELPTFYRVALSDPTSLPGLIVLNTGGWMGTGACNTRESHAAELPALGGIGNGRALAGMYAPLANGGGDLVTPEQLAQMGAVSAAGIDASVLMPSRWTLGFMKALDNRAQGPGDRDFCFMSEEAFGHAGMGGSMGFADPKARLSFGYVMNKQGGGLALNERGQSLIDAVYRALGYKRVREGIWYD
ncbi:MAG: serine hydrolase domain-containing protein [Actinomycetota bacterium]